MKPLLNKPNVNGVTLREQSLSQKDREFEKVDWLELVDGMNCLIQRSGQKDSYN